MTSITPDGCQEVADGFALDDELGITGQRNVASPEALPDEPGIGQVDGPRMRPWPADVDQESGRFH